MELHQDLIDVEIEYTDKEAKKLDKEEGNAGYDLRACNIVYTVLEPNQKTTVIDTGIKIAMPNSLCAVIKPRSGLGIQGIDVHGGLIDPNFRGGIKVILINHCKDPIVIKKYDRIAQLIFLPIPKINLIEKDSLSETNRGCKGFGSSGMK